MATSKSCSPRKATLPPHLETILKKYENKFDLKMKLTKIDDFGGWKKAYEKFFNEGALFDKIYEN